MAMKYWYMIYIIQVCLNMAHMLNTPFPAFICCNSHGAFICRGVIVHFHDGFITKAMTMQQKNHPSPSTRTRAGRVCVLNCATPSLNHIECLVTCFSVRSNKNKQTNLKFEKCPFPLYVAISACSNFAGQQMDRCLWHATCRVWHEIPQLCLVILPLYSYIYIYIYCICMDMYGYLYVIMFLPIQLRFSTASPVSPVAKKCSSRPEPWVSWQQRQRGVHLSRLSVCIGYIYI